MNQSAFTVGSVGVVTTNHGGHRPEYYAESLTNRLVNVAETTPEPLKAQAFAFKDVIRALSLHLIKAAIRSDRTTLVSTLRDAGFQEAAQLVATLEV